MVVLSESIEMKNVSLLAMVVVAFLLFIIGLFIPGTLNPWHIFFVTAGMLTGFVFYLLSFRKMRKDKSLSDGRKMLWTVVIVCLPMIGNTFYIIVDMMSSFPQISHHRLSE